MCLLQRIDRESTKSPASTGGRKKAAVKSNGQIATADPPPQPPGMYLLFLFVSAAILHRISYFLSGYSVFVQDPVLIDMSGIEVLL